MMRKKIFLGNERKMLRYATHENLQDEAEKYNIAIGENVTIGDGSTIENDVTIENNTVIKYNVIIGDGADIGNGVTIGDYSRIGNNVTIGNSIEILERAKIEAGWTIEDIVHLKDEYKYHVSAYRIDGQIIIQLGCYTRTLDEWENDFWNNDFEFKKGTPEGEQRLIAFNKMKEIMKRRKR